IVISETKRKIARLIASEPIVKKPDLDYFLTLWQGAMLPSDKPDIAKSIIEDLKNQIENKNLPILQEKHKTPADLAIQRHHLEQILFEQEEQAFADNQKNEIENILGWLKVIETKKNVTLTDGTTIKFPKGEAPAYLEWILWRAFLAINSLVNKSWEARRFS